MYLDTIGDQSRVFLYSCGFGFLLGFLFDVFSFLGEFFPKKRGFIIARDFVYMVFCTFLMFLFGLSVHNGSFKFYVYAGAAIGWLIYYFSAGAFTRRVHFVITAAVKDFFRKFKRGILSFTSKIKEKRAKKLKKSEISSNLLLQDTETLLYNKDN